MRDYIVGLSMTALIVSILEVFAPKEYEKYVKLAAGVLMLSVMIFPVAKLGNFKLPSEISERVVEDGALTDKVSAEMQKRVEQDIETRLQEEFGIESGAEVKLKLDENGRIAGVEEIYVKVAENPDKMQERLEEVYGCTKIRIEFK